MKADKKVFWIGLLLLCSMCSGRLWGQVNVSGKAGLIYIPSAELLQDGTFTGGYVFNPMNYAIKYNRKNSESIYFVNLAVLPRLEVNINLLRPNGWINGRIGYYVEGIGDRQIDLKYGILREKEKRPSLAIILSAPFSVQSDLVTTALVATKNVKVSRSIETQFTAGIGSPYSLFRDECDCRNDNIFSNFAWQDKRDKAYRYLSGPFGGAKISYAKTVGLMFEWDSQHFNIGGYATLFKHWTFQAALLNGDQLTASTSYSLNLFQLPKRLRKHEGN